MHNNRFVYEINLPADGMHSAEPPTEGEVQAQMKSWPELNRSEAEAAVVLERFVENLVPELGSDTARVELALLEGNRLRVTLHVPMDEASVQTLVARHLNKLGFTGGPDRNATVNHPLNRPLPGTTFH